MMSNKTIIYILPHFDDEFFVIPRINHDLKNKNNVKFFFLMNSESRLKESQKFLKFLGVSAQDIVSLGRKLNVEDGSIHLYMDAIYLEICKHLKSMPRIDEIVCTAYGGGHNDHDSAAVISRSLAKLNGAKILEFYLYNGHHTKGRFYRVANPINITKAESYPYLLKDRIAAFIAPIFYLSQIKAMLGLWPFLMGKIIRNIPLTVNILESNEIKFLKHSEVPLYERWGRISQNKLLPLLQNFRRS